MGEVLSTGEMGDGFGLKSHGFLINEKGWQTPSKIEWDLTNGPLRKLLELLDSQVEGSVQWVLFEISWTNRKPSMIWQQ